jgi:hypothetical protein
MLGSMLRPMLVLSLLPSLALAACGPSPSSASRSPSGDGSGDDERLLSESQERARAQGEAPDRDASDRPPRTIYRSEIARATDPGPAYLLRQLTPEPFRHHGVFVGWELTSLFPDDPHLCGVDCDVAVGDVILSVNGSRLETPQQLSDALERLPQANRLVVHSLRDGERREVTYRIVED